MNRETAFKNVKLPSIGGMIFMALAALTVMGMFSPQPGISRIWNEAGGFAGTLCLLVLMNMRLKRDELGFSRLLAEGAAVSLGHRVSETVKFFLMYLAAIFLLFYSAYAVSWAVDHFYGGKLAEMFEAWIKSGELQKGGRSASLLAPAPVWWTFWTLCMAPFFEELFFRRFFYVALRKRFGFVVSVVVSSCLFGIIHGPIPLLMLVTGVLGAFLAWFYEKKMDFGATVAFHALNNAASLFILWAAK